MTVSHNHNSLTTTQGQQINEIFHISRTKKPHLFDSLILTCHQHKSQHQGTSRKNTATTIKSQHRDGSN